jgi:hypothetical protein
MRTGAREVVSGRGMLVSKRLMWTPVDKEEITSIYRCAVYWSIYTAVQSKKCQINFFWTRCTQMNHTRLGGKSHLNAQPIKAIKGEEAMPGTPCWDFMKCGMETHCPAYPDHGFDCWNVEGTLCRGQKQGSYDAKVGSCRSLCGYYQGIMMGTIKVI